MKHTETKFYCDICTEQIHCKDGVELEKNQITAYVKSEPLKGGMFRCLDLHICDSCKATYIKEFPLIGYSSGGILNLYFKSKSEVRNE